MGQSFPRVQIGIFKVKENGSSYALDSIAIKVDITVNSVTAHLESSASFSKVGETTLDYEI